ncbi:MAG: hypothetical protein Q9227_004738 [Pyrenula ochraceoflavens]
MRGYKICIIGAGPAGCTLARLLAKSSSQVTIFEGDKSLDFRSQGGTLDLRNNGGLLALKEAGLYDEFLKHARFHGEAMIIADKDLKAYVKASGNTSGKESWSMSKPEIDRKQLRQLLYDALPPGIVRWDHKVQSVTQEEDGKTWTINLANGSSEGGFDLIVGTDGAYSKVRGALTDTKPEYTGVHGLYFSIPNAESEHQDLYDLVNRGSVLSFSDGRSVVAQYLSDGSLHCSATGARSESWASDRNLSINEPKALKEAMLREYEDWHPLLRKLIQVADESSFMFLPLYMLPVGSTWTHRAGLTLIGDAAHLTTPYAGMGVNIAMQDAVLLAQAILRAEQKIPNNNDNNNENDDNDNDSQTKAALDNELIPFETDMFHRAREVQEISWANTQDMFFTPGAPRSVIERYIGRMAASGVPWPFKGVARGAVWGFYWVWKMVY